MRKAFVLIVLLSVTACAGPTTRTAAPQPEPHLFDAPGQQAPPTVGGLAPVVSRIETTQPYVFLTIDDGAVRDPLARTLMRGTRPTLFLNSEYVRLDPDYFRSIAADVGAHTVNHLVLPGRSHAEQRKEICDDADAAERVFGTRPVLFRPPFGRYDDTTRRVTADCGMKAVVLWTASVTDGVMGYEGGGSRLHPGDIVLMHFTATFAADYQAFARQAMADGLTPMPLADFLR